MCLLPLARPLLPDPRALLDLQDLEDPMALEDLVVQAVPEVPEVPADQEVTLWRSSPRRPW